jgi:ADP-ribosylation factor-binding protein GGA
MEPQTGRVLQPYEKEGVVQMIRLSGPQLDGKTVKMRWKASYRLGTGPLTEEQGVVDGVPFA